MNIGSFLEENRLNLALRESYQNGHFLLSKGNDVVKHYILTQLSLEVVLTAFRQSGFNEFTTSLNHIVNFHEKKGSKDTK